MEFISSKHKVANTYEDGIAQAVNAGLNIRTHFTPPADFILPLRKAVADGKISQETLDKRVAEILRVKFWLGLFDNPIGVMVNKRNKSSIARNIRLYHWKQPVSHLYY